MTPLDKKKREVELLRVRAAREELELRILERLDDIKRMEASIEIQLKRETELKNELLNQGEIK